MNTLNKITNFLEQNQKNIFYILFFFGIFVFSFDMVVANTGLRAISSTGDPDLDRYIKLFNGVIAIISVLMTMITTFIGIFLHPEWTNGAVIGLSETLRNLWILISNVVYLIFAFLFIWIAFMNIIGKEDIYQLKQAIPKFIVGVLIVPFSWFFVQFMISLSSILTTSILALPVDMIGNKDINIQTCSHFKLKTVTTIEDISSIIECSGGGKEKTIKQLLTGEGIYSIMDIYTYNIMKLDQLSEIKNSDLLNGVKTISDLVLKIGFNVIFIVIYSILVIALGLALFVRGVYLWFFAMLSPVFGLLFFFGKKEGAGDGLSKNFNIKEFIALSMVPVYVSAALAFGLIFIIVAGQNINKDNVKIKVYSSQGGGDATNVIVYNEGTDSEKRISWTGKYLGDVDGVLGGFQGAFGSLLAQLFGIVFLWIAVIAALKHSSITRNVVAPFDDFGKSIGSLIQKVPTYAPILPGGLSAEGLKRVGTMPEQALQSKVSTQVEPYQNRINKAFGTETISDKEVTDIRNMMKDGLTRDELQKVQAQYRIWVEKYGRDNSKVKELEKEILTNMSTNSITKNTLKTSGFIKGVNPDKDETINFHALGGYGYSETSRAIALQNGRSAGIYKDEKSTSSSVIGDMTIKRVSNKDYDTNTGEEIDGRIKILKYGTDDSVGVGNITIKLANGSGAESFDINIQSLSKDLDKNKISNEDLKEFLVIFDKIGKNKNNMKSILKSLGYTNDPKDFVLFLDRKSEKQQKK